MKYLIILKRLAALFIDYVLVGIVLAYCFGKLFMLGMQWAGLDLRHSTLEQKEDLLWGRLLVDWLVVFTYFWLSDGVFCKATLGKMIMKLRIVTIAGIHPGILELLLRTLFKIFPYLCLGYLGEVVFIDHLTQQYNHVPAAISSQGANLATFIILIIAVVNYGFVFANAKGQALYDKIAGTAVMSVDEPFPLGKIAACFRNKLSALRTAGHSTGSSDTQ
jgi:uncharacterized RDD family membrane protein YckC